LAQSKKGEKKTKLNSLQIDLHRGEKSRISIIGNGKAGSICPSSELLLLTPTWITNGKSRRASHRSVIPSSNNISKDAML
jgi:hypothetical protein